MWVSGLYRGLRTGINPVPTKAHDDVGTAFRLSGLLDREREVRLGRAGGVGVRGDPDYPVKKSLSSREVREVRDDRRACFVILLSWKVKVASPDVMRWSRYGYRPKKASGFRLRRTHAELP